MDNKRSNDTTRIPVAVIPKGGQSDSIDQEDVFADLEVILDEVADNNPRITHEESAPAKATTDLRALLEASVVVNSSLVLDDVLQVVMKKAVDLMQAERGLIMLLDQDGELQVRSAYNLCKEDLMEEDFKISGSITSQAAETGQSVYTSDAMADDRYANARSVMELHLRSIMCVPVKVKNRVIGVIYLDNSSEAKTFLKSDLYIFELYAQLVANALENASVYNRIVDLKKYNETVISKSPVALIVLDTKCRMATINPHALEIFDINRENIQLRGEGDDVTKFLDLLPKNEVPRWKHMLATAIGTESEFSESRYFHNTGYIEKVLSLKITPISKLLDGDNGLIISAEDITEKVIMEKYVILSEKLVAKGEMAASVAHELNNYLAIVSTNAELFSINIDRKEYDKAKFNSKAVVDNIFKIKRFIDSLMDFSKPEPEYISYDIKHVIEDLLFSLRVQPRFKQVHFTIDLGHEIPNLEMDVGQVQQVLMNLLNNAADAIEENAVGKQESGERFQGKISIAASYSKRDETVTIDVTDNGCGMSEDTLQKIFTLHFTTKKSGHGLGLSNCKKIIEQHNGRLSAESTPGKGTTFTVVLPRFQPNNEE